jgi:hypothetical protein
MKFIPAILVLLMPLFFGGCETERVENMNESSMYRPFVGKRFSLQKACYVMDPGKGHMLSLVGCGMSNLYPSENPRSYIGRKEAYGKFLDVLNASDTFVIKNIYHHYTYNMMSLIIEVQVDKHKYEKPIDAYFLFDSKSDAQEGGYHVSLTSEYVKAVE